MLLKFKTINLKSIAFENLISSFSLYFFLLLVLTSLLVIFITDNIFIILILFIETISLLGLVIYSFGSELITYSFVIIYGGGILVLYLIFMFFTGLQSESTYFSKISIKSIPALIWILGNIGFICWLLMPYTKDLQPARDQLEYFNFTNSYTSWILDFIFLGLHNYTLLVAGGFLLFTIVSIALLLQK